MALRAGLRRPMRLPAILALLLASGVVGCGRSAPAPRVPDAAPAVELTEQDKQVWAELPADRSAIPVLLYHGVGPESDFANAQDATYGVGEEDFAKQMTLMHNAGYQTVGLQTFLDFVSGKKVDLPPRPVLLTFDDGRADSWTGTDGILRKLGYSAVMFVDVGGIQGGSSEYLRWPEMRTMAKSGRWQLEMHAGPNGHTQIHYGSGSSDYGPYYAYELPGESLDQWRRRTQSDVETGQRRLADEIPEFRPLGFAPPFGNYGQDGSNDPAIAPDFLAWLEARYGAVFTQDRDARAKPGGGPVLGRLQVSRQTTGGDLHRALLSGKL